MTKQNLERLIFFLFTALIFAYLLVRVINVGPLNDETLTFFRFIHPEMFLPFAPSTPLSVNNHVLNSLLAWVSYKAFGVSEWALRLPNLLAFPLYMWYIYSLGKYLSKPYLRYLFWLLLTGAHYYLEFFAYSRGYGLSMAFLAGSLFYLIRADQEGKKISQNLVPGLLFIFLATISNLNLLVPFLIWIVLAIKILWVRTESLKPLLYFSVASVISGGFLILWSLKLNEHESAPIGKSSLSGTLDSFMRFFTGYTENGLSWIYQVMIAFTVVAGGYWLIKKRSPQISPLAGFYAFLVLGILGRVLLYHVKGINYPIERTGFHWYFFLAGAIPFVIDGFKPTLKLPLTVVTTLAFVPVFAFTFQSLSFYYSSDFGWRRQQISDDFFFHTKELNQNRDFPLSMYAPETFYTLNMAFKNLKYGGSINVCNGFRPQGTVYSSDLLIIDTARYPECTEVYEEVYYDEHSTMALMKRRPLMEPVLIADTLFETNTHSTEAFTLLGDFDLPDSSGGYSIRVDCYLEITSPENPLPSLVTLDARDTAGRGVFYEQVVLDYFETDFSNGFEQRISIVIDELPPGTKLIRCLFWNIDQKRFTLNKAHVRLSKLREGGTIDQQ